MQSQVEFLFQIVILDEIAQQYSVKPVNWHKRQKSSAEKWHSKQQTMGAKAQI